MQQYHDLLKNILENGVLKQNRTGIDTLSIFSPSIRHDMTTGFPLLTTKKMFFRGIVEEILFFLRGDTNTKILEDKGINIWKGNTSREFLDKQGLTSLPEGDIGCAYSFQWRNFNGQHSNIPATQNNSSGFDQIKDVYTKLTTNPTDRRIIISAWNPAQTKYMALPPCHILYIFYTNVEKKELSCHLTIRSNDIFLGWAFNFAELALLNLIFAKAIGYTAKEICMTSVDAHLYVNHIEQSKEQLSRSLLPLPTVNINKSINSFDDIMSLRYEDFELKNYNPHGKLSAEMAV